MPYTDNNETVLEIINKVLTRLGLSTVSALDADKFTITLCGLLNDVIDDIATFGNARWPQYYVETSALVTAYSTETKLNDLEIDILEEVAVSGQISPLKLITLEELRRLRRTNAVGVPRFFCIKSVSGLAYTIGFHPKPSVDSTLQLALYTKPPKIHSELSDETTSFGYPSAMITQGLYAHALLEEAGGQATQESQMAMAEYNKMKTETYNRFVGDTGTDTYFVPTAGYRR